MVQYLVVGQGIAGTILSYILYKNGQQFNVIASTQKPSSTEAAAGIMNPITGKYMALSWQYDVLYPIAIEMYREICLFLEIDFSFEREVIRPLKDQKSIQDWEYRGTQERYTPYISTFDPHNLPPLLDQKYLAYSSTKLAFQIPVTEIQAKWRSFLTSRGLLIDYPFHYDHFDPSSSTYKLDEHCIHFEKIIFCEGSHVIYNPYFQNLPFDPVKGEVLICKIPDWQKGFIYKDYIFIVPWQSPDLYWVGSSYEWKTDSWEPTEDKKSFILNHLQDMYTGDFEVIDHRSGIRPAIKDRKPVIGSHPQYANLIIFNGLGTKGTSLAPFVATELYGYLKFQKTISQEISIERFKTYF
jgi:glycine oxidase